MGGADKVRSWYGGRELDGWGRQSEELVRTVGQSRMGGAEKVRSWYSGGVGWVGHSVSEYSTYVGAWVELDQKERVQTVHAAVHNTGHLTHAKTDQDKEK